MANFTDLPLELIRHIASYTSYNSIINLSCVSVQFWNASQDWTIHKNLLRHTQAEVFDQLVDYQTPTAATWKNFAFANSQSTYSSPNTTGYLEWAPQLMALHHRLNSTANISELLRSIDQSQLSHARVAAFCFASRALSFDMPTNGAVDTFYDLFTRPYSVTNCITDWSCRALDASVFKLSTMGPLWNDTRLMALDEWPTERDQMHATALKALAFLSIDVKSAVLKGEVYMPQTRHTCARAQSRSSNLAIPRSAMDIPFSSFMALPIPFGEDAVPTFSACHLPKMTTSTFLEQGEWSGIEFGSRLIPSQAARTSCIYPFTLSISSEDATSDIVEAQSSPAATFGNEEEFHMRVKKSSGVAQITFFPGPFAEPVHWQGILTPFGFVGTTTLNPGDWFWLWKTNWAGDYKPKVMYDWSKLWGRGRMDVVRPAVSRL